MIKNRPDEKKEGRSTGAAAEYGSLDVTSETLRVESGRGACGNCFAVIDTETNWQDEVMSVGVVIADAATFACADKRYYIIEPESFVGGFYSSAMHKADVKPFFCGRDKALEEIRKWLSENGITKILAYNARFDLGHLHELSGFQWYDIMRLAAYKQYNQFIPASRECCKTGRLKGSYGVEAVLRMMTGDLRYCETHNAVTDACDEMRIVELLGLELEAYEVARIN